MRLAPVGTEQSCAVPDCKPIFCVVEAFVFAACGENFGGFFSCSMRLQTAGCRQQPAGVGSVHRRTRHAESCIAHRRTRNVVCVYIQVTYFYSYFGVCCFDSKNRFLWFLKPPTPIERSPLRLHWPTASSERYASSSVVTKTHI